MPECYRFNPSDETCPYLPDRVATMEYRDVEELTPEEYEVLLASGWRRFGRTLLRPRCRQCSECVPIRLAIDEFRPSRSQRRALRRNSDLAVQVCDPTVTIEHVELYLRYHKERHETRHWPEVGFDLKEYLHCFLANAAPTHEFQFRLDGDLIGVGYAGESALALNSIYAFFDPDSQRRSLGSLNVLTQVDEARRRGKTYLYLGYWIRDCPSMAYKARFRPHQLRIAGQWE